MNQTPHKIERGQLALLLVLLLSTSLGCSLGRIIVGDPTPTPSPVAPSPLPTWTPSPVGQLSPAQMATLTVQAGLSWPTLTPTITPIPSDTPSPTPPPPATATPLADTPTPTITLTPTPFVSVEGQVVNVRQGPSVAYPILGQVRAGDLYTLVGRNEAGTWWQICCINGSEAWISAQLVAPAGTSADVPVVGAPGLAPTAVPTATPGPTDTPRPYRPFDIGDGPQFFPAANAWLTIWVKVFKGQPPIFLEVPGYRLRVLRNGVDVSKSDESSSIFQWSAPPDLGSRRLYNLKYEYQPQAGDAQWTIYLTDRGGTQLSPEVTFETEIDGLLREVYVGFYDLR